MRFRTLRGRLTAVALVAATIAVALAVAAFNVLLVASVHSDVRQRLRTRAEAAATTVSLRDGRLVVRARSAADALDARVWVFDGARPVLRAPAPPGLQRAAQRLAGRDDVFADAGDPDTRLYALAVRRGGRQVGTVVAAQPLDGYDHTIAAALVGSILLGAVLLAVVYAAAWMLAGRALAPVTEMTRTAAQWSEHDPDRRFGGRPRPDELGELARTFDALLDRLAAALRREQRLSAELSHELRTPLARITAEMELLQRRDRSPQERREAYDVVARSAEQMDRILATLMAAARAESAQERGRSALADAFTALDDEWRPVLAGRGVALRVAPTGETVGVDGGVVERIVSPLLDNAARHAVAAVQLDARRAGPVVQVRVADDGPGVAAADRARVFEPGVRGAGAGGDGAGLGLALARRLARASGGEVRLDGDGGAQGSAFVVDLPA
ncbi:MAG: histidine kinase dimerization/phospho-acceptor domain-containing protein [Solirubrobacteraceae bacterium]